MGSGNVCGKMGAHIKATTPMEKSKDKASSSFPPKTIILGIGQQDKNTAEESSIHIPIQ